MSTAHPRLKAARLYRAGDPLVVEDVAEPSVRPGMVKVRIMRCGICRTDVHFAIEGLMKPAIVPQILGHEAAGQVVEVGSDVKRIEIGDRVIIATIQGCDHCEYCRAGKENLCSQPRTFGFQVDGGYAEYAVVPANYLAVIPDSLSWDSCVLADAGAASYHAVRDIARVKANDEIVILGAGGLGLIALQLSKLAGAHVTVADLNLTKLDLARDLGADHTVKTTDDDYIQQITDSTDGKGPDTIFEFVSKTATIEKDLKVLGKGGTLVFVGYDPTGLLQVHPLELIKKEVSIHSSKGATFGNLLEVVSLAGEGKLRLSVTETLPLSEVNTALRLLKDDRVLGRICIDPQES